MKNLFLIVAALSIIATSCAKESEEKEDAACATSEFG